MTRECESFFKKMYVVGSEGKCLLGIKEWFAYYNLVFDHLGNIAKRSKWKYQEVNKSYVNLEWDMFYI